MELGYILCPLCGTDHREPLFSYGGERRVRCPQCGLIYVNPRRSRAAIETFYEEDYYSQERTQAAFAARLGFFEEAARRIERMAGGGRLLDVGCGYGHFLQACQRRGWQVKGVELSGAAGDRARAAGLEVFRGSLAQAGYPAERFDVVTLWNVLDHLAEPLAEAREIMRVLRPGGLLFGRSPNAAFHLRANQAIRLLNRLGLQVRDVTVFHLISFSPATARRFLARAGFADIRVVNSPMSRIDPWAWPRDYRSWLTGRLKQGLRLGVSAMALASAGRWLVAPSLEFHARKPQGS